MDGKTFEVGVGGVSRIQEYVPTNGFTVHYESGSLCTFTGHPYSKEVLVKGDKEKDTSNDLLAALQRSPVLQTLPGFGYLSKGAAIPEGLTPIEIVRQQDGKIIAAHLIKGQLIANPGGPGYLQILEGRCAVLPPGSVYFAK